MESVDCNTNTSESTLIPWSYQTNWIIAYGSLESSVSVESSDHPISEPDPEFTAAQSPLILKPSGSDSAPCEIKICFKQKHEVAQIYVRSSARAYEIYYATSPHSMNEYVSTVRCGVAERDDKVLQTSFVEDVAEEHGECLSRDVTAETASNEGSPATSEDEWVKIKVTEAEGSPASNKIGTNGLNNIQDLYEATAQISDLDPCLSLTIRLLSLQDKGFVYVDEIYVFVEPVQSTDSGNEAVSAGSSAQSSLMAMFMPTLLQLSKSGVSRAQDTHASDKLLKNGAMETAPTVDKIDSPQQFVKPKELGKDTAESAEPQLPTSANKCVETKIVDSSRQGHLETAMEQLISRLSRVEDIFLRFEEKMLQPIERIEARLQQVELQLGKLTKRSHDFDLPRCTRISAPEFPCSESNTSSFYNDELEKKDFACDNMPDLSHEERFHPGLIISAPEFSNGEGDEDDDNLEPLEPLKDSPQMMPKKTLSVDDALAAALHGFLSTPSKPIQTTIGLPCDVNEQILNEARAESCQLETIESPSAENNIREPSQNAEVLAVKAPEFATEETRSEKQLIFDQSTLHMASVTENEKKAHCNETVPSSSESSSLFKSAESCGLGGNKSTNVFASASDGYSPTVSVMSSRTCLVGDLNGRCVVNMIETYFEGDTISVPAENDSSVTVMHEVPQEINLGKLTSCKLDDQYAASEENSRHEVETVSEGDAERVLEPSQVAFLDLNYPILEVRFASDEHMSIKSPLEALLDGAAESNTEAPSIITKEIDTIRVNGDETKDLPSTNGLLLDLEDFAADVSSHLELEGASHSSAEMASSLI